MAPLFTLARHAATYHAGIPTHSWEKHNDSGQWDRPDTLHHLDKGAFLTITHPVLVSVVMPTLIYDLQKHWKCFPNLEPHHDGGSVPLSERQTLPTGFLQQFMSENTEETLGTCMYVQKAWVKHGRMICTYMKQSYGQRTALVKMWGNSSWISKRVKGQKMEINTDFIYIMYLFLILEGSKWEIFGWINPLKFLSW